MPATDLDLLRDAAAEAGEAALRFWRRDPDVRDKGDGQGPVSEADLAANAVLEARLRRARPGHAWLSEESPDDPGARAAGPVWIVDPIDGTRAFLKGETDWAVSAALVVDGAPVAGVVHLPAKGLTYAAAAGGGAARDGAAIRVTGDPGDPPTVLTTRANLKPERWPNGAPALRMKFRPSLAQRLCLVAEGRYDGMLTLRDSWYWDIAAGALIAAESGAVVTDRTGAPLRFDAPVPLGAGCITAAPAVHGALLP
ncbi:MAG: 3'(2'),5'-bisphosphate nucleotidase CysQ [Hasllibacter sp.]